MEYTKPEDFRESEWFEVDEDRGLARRHRVYKRLLFAPAVYREDGSGEDFEYLKYYGYRLSISSTPFLNRVSLLPFHLPYPTAGYQAETQPFPDSAQLPHIFHQSFLCFPV